MLELDKTAVDKILCRLEEAGLPFENLRLCKEAGELCLLGKGGYSAVYEMYDVANPKKHYALKVIGFERHTLPRQAFYDTIELQNSLSKESPHIVNIVKARSLMIKLDPEGEVEEVLTTEGLELHFVLMEKLEGLLLKDKFRNVTLARQELSRETEVLNFAGQIGQALLLMHRNHVLHRDVKLENIFWNEEKQLYQLGDFDIAKYVQNHKAETVVYTDGYGAPEVGHRNEEYYNETADIYSFGMMLYLLLNELCFPGANGYYVNMVQYSREFTFPAAKHASEELNRVIRKMCSYEPEERYQSMVEVLARLNQVSEQKQAEEPDSGEELADLSTETYRTMKKDSGRSGEAQLPERILRKQHRETVAKEYEKRSMWSLLIWSVLFVLMLQGVQQETAIAQSWQLWVLPIVFLLEAVFLGMKEFYISFGIAAVGLTVYSMMVMGVTLPHAILLCCLVSGVPTLLAAGALGTGVWMWLTYSEQLMWLDVLREWEICWIMPVIIIVMLDDYIILSYAANPEQKQRVRRWLIFEDNLPVMLVAAGVVLWLVEVLGVVELPGLLVKLHPVWAGILIGIRNIYVYWRDCWDVSLDKSGN